MKKILVIEDNPAVNDNLCEILELTGYEVSTALNGKNGTELAFAELPDLILCDVLMPNLDGYGVLKILSQNEKTARIPFIFLTAKSEMKDLRKGMNLGAADYILKPFDDSDLLQTIELRLAKNQVTSSNYSNLKSDFRQKINELKAEWTGKYEVRTFPARTMIYAADQQPLFIYFIVDGVVRIQQTNTNGKRLTVQLAANNQLVGGNEILPGHTFSSSAIALIDCKIILIPKTDYLDLLNQDDAFSMYIHQQAALTLNTLQSSLVEMAYGSVRRRVALGLIAYGKALFQNELQDGSALKMPREDLAELVGSAKETVIRTLSDFNSEGLIELKNNEIILTNISSLQTMPD